MSKASEWATAPKPTRPMFADSTGRKAYVDDDGRLLAMAVFEPSQAMEFARWILDTFGETE